MAACAACSSRSSSSSAAANASGVPTAHCVKSAAIARTSRRLLPTPRPTVGSMIRAMHLGDDRWGTRRRSRGRGRAGG